MASKTVPVNFFQQGWYMFYVVYTQAKFEICFTLKDSAKIYVNGECRTGPNPGYLVRGDGYIQGNDLQITIDIAQSPEIKTDIDSHAILRPDGTIAGYVFTMCVEDYTDKDYNDLTASLVCWEHKG